ncbi:MAG TPA: hypothetical protein VFX93_13790, partial [Xanthomonadaceae bacterium]|nr:hypothetical protein [Xanthomonadaceae bacterium]
MGSWILEGAQIRSAAGRESPNEAGKLADLQKSFRLKASYFLCWCKESNQRKHLLVKSTPLSGDAVLSPFSDSPSMARSENGRHPCRPPSGC